MRKPLIGIGGAIGHELNRLWDALLSREPATSFGLRTNRTTLGTTLEVPPASSFSGSVIKAVTVKAETREWLKCQTLAQEGTEKYTWVAKPIGLRAGVAVTAETYPEVSIWGEQFVGEKYLYRDATERLKLWAPAGGDRPFGLLAGFTPYERWADGGLGVKADVDDLRTALVGTSPFPSQVGEVDYIYSFEKIHPIYADYNRVGASPHQGQPMTLHVTRYVPEQVRTADRPTEVPEDATFESAAVKYIDLNLDARRWMPSHIVHPFQAMVMNVGSPWGAMTFLPEQYTDQTWGGSDPQIKSLLPSFWTELTP